MDSRWLGALLVGPSLLAQADYPLTGVVTTKEGKPIAGVTVYGSMSKDCCPFKRDQATTDQNGQFRIEHPGGVIHFSKEKLKPKALVIASEKAPI
jgi:uncharacterized GH25 family protein